MPLLGAEAASSKIVEGSLDKREPLLASNYHVSVTAIIASP